MRYIIEIEEEPYVRRGENALYRAKGFNSLVFDQVGLDKLTPFNKELEESYQKGLCDGKARNEDGCIGCRYDDGTTEHSPCNYCCNAYSNQWSAKPCSDEIEVGDEVEAYSGRAIVFGTFIDKNGDEFCRYWYPNEDRFDRNKTKKLKKTGRHFSQVAELLKVMKGEQRNCSTCKYDDGKGVPQCTGCFSSKGYNMWEPKEGAE